MTFERVGDEIRLACPTGWLVLSERDGHIVRLSDKSGTVLAGPSFQNSLWKLNPATNQKNYNTYAFDPPIGMLKRAIMASHFSAKDKTFTWLWNPTAATLTLSYKSSREPVQVRITIRPTDDGFRIVPSLYIEGSQSAEFYIPYGITFDYNTIDRFHYPNDFAVAFTPKFFKEGRSVSIRYPVAFSDLMFWTRQDKAGPVAVYRSEADYPFMPSTAVLIPSMFARKYNFVTMKSGWVHCPQFDIVIGQNLRTISRRYAKLRGLGPKISDKLPEDLYEKLIASVVFKYGSSTQGGPAARARTDFELQMKNLHRYPSPSVIHIVSYLYWGFDRGYPDYVRPSPAWTGGGPEKFAQLVAEIHKQGKIWMPHTNPTFWNIEPRKSGRTPDECGDDVYMRGADGNFFYDGGNYGRTGKRIVSPMHPTTLEVYREIIRDLKQRWQVDVLFADQMANRWGNVDFNRNTGYPPHGYIQQLTDMAADLKRIVPHAMEGGFDLQVPNAVIFHRLSWPLRGDPAGKCPYNERFGKDCWEWSPMVQYAIHDRVISNLHNLGDTVDNEQMLVTILAHGYSIMSNATHGRCDTLKDTGRQMRWIWWLDAVQKNICARYLGQELLDFKYVAKYVIETRYPGLRITCNLTGKPFRLNHKRLTLAPFGWFVESENKALWAGHVTEVLGCKLKFPVSFIWLNDRGTVKVWLHARKAPEIRLPNVYGELHTIAIPQMPQRNPIVLSSP
jgi:hypothetical protein